MFKMTIFRQFMGLTTWVKVLLIFVSVWVLFILIFASKLNTPNVIKADEAVRRLNNAIATLDNTKKINADLRSILDEYMRENSANYNNNDFLVQNFQNKFPTQQNAKNEPMIEYEQLRRRVGTNVGEFWNYLHFELNKVQEKLTTSNTEVLPILKNFLSLAVENKRSLMNDIQKMKETDGYEAWRHEESKNLSDLVQRRLTNLQNPEDCSKARKLICRLNKGCGYGCQLHHVVYCFIMAYATDRTMILKSKGWRYHKGGWEEVFKPVSETCTDGNGNSHASWPGSSNTQVLTIPIIDSLNPRPPFLPLAIPADLAPRMIKLHGDPIVWWIGQFLKYLLKPQPATKEMLDSGMSKLGFKKPIVGVHIRRTDKVGTEAAFHKIEEYMKAVDEYYAELQMVQKIDKRRVFIASDDPKVIDEARIKYTEYEVIGNPDVAKLAAVSTRYTDSSLNGIIMDIHLLSLCDYLVCTFSSQVCRVAYEIMQTMYPDASSRFKSLDDIYYYGGQNSHNREVVIPHKPKNHDEIHMNVGDSIGVAGNHWNGFSKGKNTRTNELGLFPSFKVNDKVEIVEFPAHTNIK